MESVLRGDQFSVCIIIIRKHIYCAHVLRYKCLFLQYDYMKQICRVRLELDEDLLNQLDKARCAYLTFKYPAKDQDLSTLDVSPSSDIHQPKTEQGFIKPGKVPAPSLAKDDFPSTSKQAERKTTPEHFSGTALINVKEGSEANKFKPPMRPPRPATPPPSQRGPAATIFTLKKLPTQNFGKFKHIILKC